MSKTGLILSSPDSDEEIRMDSGSSMQNGVVTIHKTLYFKVPDGENPREYNDLDVYTHKNFPLKYSALSQDARYVFYGNASISHQEALSRYFVADLEYSSSSNSTTDVNGKSVTSETPPWDLLPSDIRFGYPERKVPFQASYAANGTLVSGGGRDVYENEIYSPAVPVVNSAGDPFKLDTIKRDIQMSFTYATRNWEPRYSLVFGNTINASSIKICGFEIAAGRALLATPEASYVITYQENSTKVKWKYWNVNISITIDTSGLGLTRRVLNVGDRAWFPATTYTDYVFNRHITLPASQGPEPICCFRDVQLVNLGSGSEYQISQTGAMVYCGWHQYLAIRHHYLVVTSNRLNSKSKYYDANYTGDIFELQCEQMTQMPLIPSGSKTGQLDVTAIQSHKYPILTFREYPYRAWSAMNLPRKGYNS